MEEGSSRASPSAHPAIAAATEAGEPSALEAERELAMAAFPREWEATLSLTGEKRRKRQRALRSRAALQRELAPLRALGLCCANCPKTARIATTTATRSSSLMGCASGTEKPPPPGAPHDEQRHHET
jgi:hypothetical protein